MQEIIGEGFAIKPSFELTKAEQESSDSKKAKIIERPICFRIYYRYRPWLSYGS